MPFLGTLVNAGAVLVGSVVGSLVGEVFPQDLRGHLHRILGVLTVGIAAKMVVDGDIVKGGFTLIAGYLIGYLLRLDGRLRRLIPSGGVIAAVVIFCTGPMTVLGSIQDAFGQPDLLLIKSLLDGTVSVIFGATFGISMALSAVFLLLIQGGIEVITLSIGGSSPDPAVLSVLNGTGGLILFLIGLNLLDLTDFPTADTLPALLLVPLWSFFL